MPAMPMNEAAERYSPEIAEAFQPTDTARPATKKSLAVFDRRADQKPMPMVAATVTNEKAKIHGSTSLRKARVVMGSAFDRFHLVRLERDRTPDEEPGDDPYEWEEQHPEDEPAQREPENARRHDHRREVVGKRQAEQDHEKRGRAGHGELQLPAHERTQKLLAMHGILGRRGAFRSTLAGPAGLATWFY